MEKMVYSPEILLRVNDEDVSALSLSEVSPDLRRSGTRVSLLVGENEEKLFWVERSNACMPTVQSLIDKNIGYIISFICKTYR
ncbi:MAG: hypothetical protein ACLUIQ_09445 [Dialister invisus]